jgi:hypothetical protein
MGIVRFKGHHPHQTSKVKPTTTMVELFAGSSGMGMANQAMPSWYPLHDALFEGAGEGFSSIM